MLEGSFKTDLIEEIETIFPGSICLHLNPHEKQGIPDILVMYGCKWATLEGKRSEHEHHQPNQDYYVNLMNNMGFSAFIHPGNKQHVLYLLDIYFTDQKEIMNNIVRRNKNEFQQT